MELKYSKKSWHAWLYRSFYCKDELPTNLCPYFWKVVLSFLLIPLTFPIHIFHFFTKKRNQNHWCINAGILFALEIWKIGVVVILILLIILILVFAFVSLCFFVNEKTHVSDKISDGIIADKFKSFIGRYCPKINWE